MDPSQSEQKSTFFFVPDSVLLAFTIVGPIILNVDRPFKILIRLVGLQAQIVWL